MVEEILCRGVMRFGFLHGQNNSAYVWQNRCDRHLSSSPKRGRFQVVHLGSSKLRKYLVFCSKEVIFSAELRATLDTPVDSWCSALLWIFDQSEPLLRDWTVLLFFLLYLHGNRVLFYMCGSCFPFGRGRSDLNILVLAFNIKKLHKPEYP